MPDGNSADKKWMEEENVAGKDLLIHFLDAYLVKRDLERALACLSEAVESIPDRYGVMVNEPIPMAMMRIANMERAQLLLESASRLALQRMLKAWLPVLRGKKSAVRWQIEVDPMTI